MVWVIVSKKGGRPCHYYGRSIMWIYRKQISNRLTGLCGSTDRPTVRFKGLGWQSYLKRRRSYSTVRWPDVSGGLCAGFKSGENAGKKKGSRCRIVLVGGARRFFPPKQITLIKAVACELPARQGQPLSRLFVPDIQRIVLQEKSIASISCSTIWRILDADVLKPWRHHSWIWSRDPQFFERAAPVLDLYQGIWQGRSLRKDEYVLSADEKTSIQARRRLHPSEVHADGRGQRVEHEYNRGGAWAYLAALDVHRAKVFGRVESSNGITPFHRLVDQVMTREPYTSARRVFWIVDQGSSHHPATFPSRLPQQFRNAVPVILPVHASWLNQIEIYFSILQRKALTPNDFSSLKSVAERIHNFENLFMKTADPFQWNFTRDDLHNLLNRIPGLRLSRSEHKTLQAIA